MSDVVEPVLLRKELKRFFDQDQSSAGINALRRAKQALDSVALAVQGPHRITKAVTRVVWGLLSEELVRVHSIASYRSC